MVLPDTPPRAVLLRLGRLAAAMKSCVLPLSPHACCTPGYCNELWSCKGSLDGVMSCFVLLGLFPLTLGQKGYFFTNTSCDGEVFQKYFSKRPQKEFIKFQNWICGILQQKKYNPVFPIPVQVFTKIHSLQFLYFSPAFLCLKHSCTIK